MNDLLNFIKGLAGFLSAAVLIMVTAVLVVASAALFFDGLQWAWSL